MKLALVQIPGRAIGEYARTKLEILAIAEQACLTGADLVLLPECAYPAYDIGLDETRASLAENPSMLDGIAALAKSYGCYIALGIALEDSGALYNSAVVYDRKGVLVNRADKSNLWHFDRSWFTAGKPACVFETDFGKVGVIVCADGRIPEITRILRLQGAGLILDCANLVASAAEPKLLSNQQYQFMLQARAKENGVYIALSNKVGVESGAITFLGRSFLVAPDGSMPVACSPDQPEIRVCELTVPVHDAAPAARRPALYGALIEPVQALPVAHDIKRAYRLDDLALYTAAARFAYTDKASYLAGAAKTIRVCEGIGARLTILPPYAGALDEADLSFLAKRLTTEGVLAVAYRHNGRRKAIFFDRAQTFGTLYSTHLANDPQDARIKTLRLNETVCVGALFDEEIEIPEIARCAMLGGADMLVWFDEREADAFYLKWMQTRAAENKVFVARCAQTDTPDFDAIVNPDGGVLCTTFRTRDQIASGLVNTAQSKCKDVVPGTNVVRHRIPDYYKELVQP